MAIISDKVGPVAALISFTIFVTSKSNKTVDVAVFAQIRDICV